MALKLGGPSRGTPPFLTEPWEDQLNAGEKASAQQYHAGSLVSPGERPASDPTASFNSLHLLLQENSREAGAGTQSALCWSKNDKYLSPKGPTLERGGGS